jgi:hypothetical protein
VVSADYSNLSSSSTKHSNPTLLRDNGSNKRPKTTVNAIDEDWEEGWTSDNFPVTAVLDAGDTSILSMGSGSDISNQAYAPYQQAPSKGFTPSHLSCTGKRGERVIPAPQAPESVELPELLFTSPDNSVKAIPSAAVTHGNNVGVGALSVSVPKVLAWKCKLISLKSKFPIDAITLIDSGASLSLIHKSLVDRLGLERHFLPQAKSVTTAMRQKVSLSHYVILPLSSEDLEYNALSVQLVMTPSLS